MLSRTLRYRKTSPWLWKQRASLTGGSSGGSNVPPASVAAGTRGRGLEQAPTHADGAAADVDAAASASAEPPAVDLSLHVPRGPQWEAAALPQRWLAFSDLHVSHRTRRTCLAVLEAVHEAAAARGAGILFLGDFWHTRGTLPVEPLNEVVGQLAGWQQPTLMLPGNHDQVSLGGEVHALTPLAAANPAIHAFDGPTMFLDALWLPYRRERAKLEAALAAAAAAAAAEAGTRGQALQAVFAHTDIIGALMNEAYQAHDGLPPDLFPPDIPTWTGHYHKPHTVPGSRITYIGSPYQVTRAEAGQQKRLLLLDRSTGWEVAEELPLDLGPRYFAAAAKPAAAPAAPLEASEVGEEVAPVSVAAEAAAGEAGLAGAASDSESEAALLAAVAEQPAAAEFELQLPEGLRPGDRLLLTLPAAAAKQHQKHLRKLERQGIEVEVLTPPEARAAPRIGAADGLGPQQLWERYCSWQRLPAVAAGAGGELLRGLLAGGSGLGEGAEQQHTSIQFQAVEVEGYFSFRDPVRYDLAKRGLVVVTGQVHDTAEAGVESNGAGKTALMMAPLWALTGSVDARAEGSSTARAVLADIINDESKRARVRVEGTVNGAPFVVERTANKRSSSVTFELGGEDLTTQENRLTQERIDAALGADLLGRAVFYGQSDITALLEASDRAFKQELSKLVDLEVWARAKEASRRELGSRQDALKEAGAALRERQQQADALQQQAAGLQQDAAEWEGRHAAAAAALQEEAGQLLARLRGQQVAAGSAVALAQQAAAELGAELAQLERQLAELQQAQQAVRQQHQGSDGPSRLETAERALAERQAAAAAVQADQQRWQFQLGSAVAAAQDALRQQAAAQEQAAGAAAALGALTRRQPEPAEGLAAAAGQLEQLLVEQQRQREQLDEAQQRLTAAQVEAAGQQSLLAAKQERAQQAQQEAAAANAALLQRRAELSSAAEGSQDDASVEQALSSSLAEARQRLKSVQRQLAGAQQQLGAAQGQARERRQQLEAYLQLAGSGGEVGSNASSQQASQQDTSRSLAPGEHRHEGGAICDRCQQPISQALYLQSAQRLELEAAEAERAAAGAERRVEGLQREAEAAEAAVAAAEQLEEQGAALAAAEQYTADREADAAAAAAGAGRAEQAAADLSAAVVAAERVVREHRAADERLAGAIEAAQAAAALLAERQQLEGAAAAAAEAVAEAAERLRAAEERHAEAQTALGQLDVAGADAAAAVAAAQRQVQEAAAEADEAARLEQQAALLRVRREQVQQRQRILQALLGTVTELSSASLAAAAAELTQVCGGSVQDDSASGGSFGEELPPASGAAAATDDALAALEAAAEASRACQAAAAELQQRWAWHRQQPNLPARDAALVLQQLEAASRQLQEVERKQAELEDEAALWKQVDDAFLPRGVVNFVVEGVLGDLQAAASRNLSALTSGMSLTLSPCKPSKKKDGDGVIEQIEKVVHVRLPGSLEMRQRSVRQLSGGERRRVALALALGFTELAAQRGRLRSNLVVLDEVMQHLDGEGCLRVAQLLKQLPYDSILVVAQAHSLLTQAFDATDVVVKAGGRSRVEQDSTAAVS